MQPDVLGRLASFLSGQAGPNKPSTRISMVVVNYLFDNPETQTVPLRFAALEGIKTKTLASLRECRPRYLRR